MRVFGPTFSLELAEANLGDGLSWDIYSGEVFGRENLTPEENDALDLVIAAHDPNKPLIAPVSKAQAQMALFNAGLLDDVEDLIFNHPYRPVRIWYEGANVWERGNPYVSMLAPELGLTEEQIDDLFIAASKL